MGAAKTVAQWTILGAAIGVLCGGSSALFLFLLEQATLFRESHPALPYALPLAGVVVGAVYGRWGLRILGGNNLVIDTVHEDSAEIPFRMAPMVLLGTVLTHLFGGSAGREGTAVQMGGSLADFVSHRLRVNPKVRRELLAAGIAGGFGSVFGTPIAGTLFGLEVVVVGRMSYEALVPALVAAIIGDGVTRWLGVVHTPYPSVVPVGLTPLLLGKWIVFGLAVAAVATLFVEATHRLKGWLSARLPSLALRMMAGGLAVVALWKVSGTGAYLGLSLPLLLRAFSDTGLSHAAFLFKLSFTAVTLAAGFLGGEVTPLFVVGACLGNVLGRALGIPLDLAAGVGMAATFAAASNAPIALSVMAVELLGRALLPHVVLVSVVAYLFSGHRGIYPAQRIQRPKHGGPVLPAPVRLKDMTEP